MPEIDWKRRIGWHAKKRVNKPIEQYGHKDKNRINNPPVGLVTLETDKETGQKPMPMICII